MIEIWIYFFHVFIIYMSLSVLFELKSCFQFFYSKKLENGFLMNFVNNEDPIINYNNRLSTLMAKNVLNCVFYSGIIFFCYILVKILQNLTYFDENVSKNNGTSDDTHTKPNSNSGIVLFLGDILSNETNFLLFISFLQLFLIDNIYLCLFGCYFNWKINVFLFRMFKTFKPLVVIGIGLSIYILMENYEIKELSQFDWSKKKIPNDVIDHLTEKKIFYKFIDVDDKKVGVHVVKGNFDVFQFLLTGNINIFTKNEFRSILYHSVGHVVNKSPTTRKIFFYVLVLLYIILQTVVLRSAGNINLKNFSTPKKLFILECISSVFFYRFFTLIANLFTHFDELHADRYSEKMSDSVHLAKGLIKLHLANEKNISTTLFYSLLQSSYPSLIRRLENLEFF
ncbi:hypothetical protein NGRA_0839 [Nosema granulosis]|uniref:Peptidase M48 domain-containing protein n=1 Tax=Nosema granulosis TaxID=83296 RepID=A0A9P6GZM1_9MICR|nr:hypothetical protein NGRA_0839 [Nosema granulosis]